MPDQLDGLTPEQRVQQATQKIKQERPGLEGMHTAIMGPFGRAISGLGDVLSMDPNAQTMAITNPLTGSVYYNPAAVEGRSQSQLEDTIAHEGTHYLQHQQDYAGKPWYQQALTGLQQIGAAMNPFGPRAGRNPVELEAYQTDQDRAVREGREPAPMLNFDTRGLRTKGDIFLPPQTALNVHPRQ